MQMRKPGVFLAFIVLSFICVKGQQAAISPYSGIGIGELKFDQDVVMAGMARTSTTASSEFGNEANFFNPAANRNLSYTAFGATLGSDFIKFKANDGLDSRRSNTYLTEMFIAFPLSEKTKFGVGFQPYSAVGYDVAWTYTDVDPAKRIAMKGNGTVNSLHSFVSYNINSKFSVGLRTNYLFGNITKDQQVQLAGGQLTSDYNRYTKVKGLMVTPGIMYTDKYKESNYFNLGATYTFHTSLNPRTDYLHSTYYVNPDLEKVNIDTVQYNSYKSEGHIGSEFTIGASFNKTLKYRFALEGRFFQAPNYNFENEFYSLNSGYRLAFGGWFIPDINSYKSYFQKMVYRYGAYYQKGNINIDGNNIDKYGITVGFGFPIGKKGFRDPSMINLAFDFGRQGTENNGLIKENYVQMKLGINFNETWFKRRKYN